MVYGSEAMILVKNEVASHRRTTFKQDDNNKLLTTSLDLLEEARGTARMRVVVYQQRVARYYNKKVHARQYNVKNLVLRLTLPGARVMSDGTLGPNWEGPFIVKENLGNGAYHLANMDRAILPRAWNTKHLRPYYQ